MSSVYPGGLDSFPTDRTDATVMATNQADDHNDYADAINNIEATLGVDPQDGYDDVAQRLTAMGSSGIVIASKNLSSADLLDLNNTPVELLPAPGGRLYYVVMMMVFHYRFVTTPYAEGGSPIGNAFTVIFGSTIPAGPTDPQCYMLPLSQGGSPNTKDLFKMTEDAYVFTMPEVATLATYEWLATTVEDQPISVVLSTAFGSSLTGGDSTLTIRTFYSVIDGAP